jgi:hypothetical protein
MINITTNTNRLLIFIYIHTKHIRLQIDKKNTQTSNHSYIKRRTPKEASQKLK